MEIDDRTRDRLDRQRFDKCRELSERMTRHVVEFNKMLAEAAELDLSVQVIAEQKRAADGKRAYGYVMSISCAQILP